METVKRYENYPVWIVILTTIGNGFIRGTLTCKYCKQGELGCPADRLFNKGGK